MEHKSSEIERRWRPNLFFKLFRIYFLAFILTGTVFITPAFSTVVELDGDSFDGILASAEIVFVNFYAEWCPHSQHLTPVWKEASNQFDDPTKVMFAAVNSEKHKDVGVRFNIDKYPTMKVFRYGEMAKREYRGQRSADALADFIRQQLKDTIQAFGSVDELERRLNKEKRNVIAYFPGNVGTEWENFRKVGAHLRDDCDFWIGVGPQFNDQTVNGNAVLYRPPSSENEDVRFSGDMANFEYVKEWITDKCVPLVRELTFENAEELTEEGLPFLILFRRPDDHAILETFTQEVARQLIDQKNSINFLVANGAQFSHPLHHLGKTEKELPILVIDSFRHMYVFEDIKDLTTPGKLRQFIMDLHSGKLHREFHHGPDPTPEPAPEIDNEENSDIPSSENSQEKVVRTSPPESVFQKLKPSQYRYTLTRDEL